MFHICTNFFPSGPETFFIGLEISTMLNSFLHAVCGFLMPIKNIFPRYFQPIHCSPVYWFTKHLHKKIVCCRNMKKTLTNSMLPVYFNKWLTQTYCACSDLHVCSSVLLQWEKTRYPCIYETHKESSQMMVECMFCQL